MIDYSGQGSYEWVYDVTTLPDGSIVAVGGTHAGVPNVSLYGAIVHLTAAGERDAAFGDNGVVRVTVPGDELAGGPPVDADGKGLTSVGLDRVAAQADGKIVVGGTAQPGDASSGSFVLRLNAP